MIMKTILQEKETIHGSITLWYTNLFFCTKPWKFQQQEQRWTRNEKNWRKLLRGTWDEGRKSSFASLMDMSFEKSWIGDKAPKIQRSSCLPRWYCKRWFRILRSIHRTRDQHHKWQEQKSWVSYPDCQGCAGQAADAVSVFFLTQIKMERCSEIIEKSHIGMSKHLDSSTTTHMAKIMVQYGRPSRSSWSKSVRSSFGRTVVGKAIWENPIEVWLGKGFQLGMPLFVHRDKWLFLSVYVEDIKLAGKKQNLDPMWKVLNKEVDLGEPTSFIDLYIWDVLKDNVK